MLYFFINPASRSGKGKQKWEEAEKYLKEKNIPYEAHFLEADVSPRSVMEDIFAREGTSPVSIVLIGGDGTVNQCLNGIPDFERLELSVIPTGSGNDFCRNKPIPKALAEQIDNIIGKKNHLWIDRGVLTYSSGNDAPLTRYFLVSNGIGYDAEICLMANQSKLKKALNKIKLGKLVYLVIGVMNIFGTKLADMKVRLDGKEKTYPGVFFIAVMNQPFEGGGVAMTPKADDTDGKLDILVVHTISKLQALFTIPLLYIKKHEGRPGITTLRGKDIEIISSLPKTIHYDGEPFTAYDRMHSYLDGKVHFVY